MSVIFAGVIYLENQKYRKYTSFYYLTFSPEISNSGIHPGLYTINKHKCNFLEVLRKKKF